MHSDQGRPTDHQVVGVEGGVALRWPATYHALVFPSMDFALSGSLFHAFILWPEYAMILVCSQNCEGWSEGFA